MKLGLRKILDLGFSVRLAFGLTALSLLALLVMYIIINTVVHDIMYDNIIGLTQSNKIIYAREIDAWFGTANQTVRSLGSALSVFSSTDYFPAIAEKFVNDYLFIENVFIGFADGSVINGIGWTPDNAGAELDGIGWGPWEYWRSTDRPWFSVSVAAGAGSIGTTDPYLSMSTGNITAAIGTWLPELCGIGATVGFSVSLDDILERLMQHQIVGGGYLMLLDAGGTVVLHPSPDYAPRPSGEMSNILDTPNGALLAESIAAERWLTEFNDINLGASYFIVTPLELVDWTLIAVLPVEATRAQVTQYLSVIMFAFALFLVLLFVFTMVVVSFLTRDMEERRVSEGWLRMIIDNMPLVTNISSKDAGVIECNEEALKMFGLQSKQEFIDKFFDLSPPFQPDGTETKAKATELVEFAYKNGRNRFEWMHQHINGEQIPCDVTFVRVRWQGEDHLLSFIRDLREFYERQRLEVAEESNRAKSRFLARMSHELRTPITAVLGISEIQLRNADLPPQLKEPFAKINNSANLLLGIVNDILDLSRIESGKLPLVEAEYELASLIYDTAQLPTVHIGNKEIDFEMKVDEFMPAYLIGDALRIRQVMNNLLSNAFKYTESGTVTLSIDCQAAAGDEGDEKVVILIISIQDTGMGMSQAQINDLQEEYSRFHEQSKPVITGTGLGMPIVYSLLQMMAAEIQLESEVGKGTHVIVRIPQKIAKPGLIGNKFSAQNHSSYFVPEPMPYGRVLVVDDMEANLYVARGLLAFYELNVECCNDGNAAIEKIKAGKRYDIIFMDEMMPGISGTESVQILRDMGYTEPIIALTANALIGQAEVFIANGFDGFISKPIQTEELNSALVSFIKNKRMAAEAE